MNTTSLITIVNPDSAGIDIGASSHFAAVPSGRYSETVKEFGCYTPDIQKMIEWLKHCNIQTVVMESSGDFYDKLNQEKTLKFLKKRAESLGYRLEKRTVASNL